MRKERNASHCYTDVFLLTRVRLRHLVFFGQRDLPADLPPGRAMSGLSLALLLLATSTAAAARDETGFDAAKHGFEFSAAKPPVHHRTADAVMSKQPRTEFTIAKSEAIAKPGHAVAAHGMHHATSKATPGTSKATPASKATPGTSKATGKVMPHTSKASPHRWWHRRSHNGTRITAADQAEADRLDKENARWLVFVLGVATVLGIEEMAMSRMLEISMRTALVWLAGFTAFSALCLAALGASDGWGSPARFGSIMLLNIMLSPDNLVVFMMFLRHAQLPTRHHRRVISDGFVLAILLRLATMLATSKLLDAFSPLQGLLALLVFAKGVQMVVDVACRAEARGDEAVGEAADHWAVRCLQRVVPVRWDTDSDGVCLFRDGVSGTLHVTRTTALMVAIGCSDLTFSSDNITAVLALTTDAYTLTVTMTLSILLLRPVYFLAAAFIGYLDALDSALGVILILIGGKLLLGQMGVEVPLWAVVVVLTAWRIVVAVYVIVTRRRGAAAKAVAPTKAAAGEASSSEEVAPVVDSEAAE